MLDRRLAPSSQLMSVAELQVGWTGAKCWHWLFVLFVKNTMPIRLHQRATCVRKCAPTCDRHNTVVLLACG